MMISDRMDINRVLAEMRSIKAQTQGVPGNDQLANPVSRLNPLNEKGVPSTTEAPKFSDLLNQAVDNVNGLQKASSQMATAYEQGQAGVNVTDVMIASQKASVSFQAMLQVRNKLVEAYRDVMNMPV